VAKLIVSCPNCNGKMAAPEGAERFRCPTCKTVLSAPKQPGDDVSVTQTATMTFAAPVPPTEVAPAPSAPPAPSPAPGPSEATSPAAPEPSPPRKPADGGELAVGQRLGGYTITRLVGHGGMGSVYEAVQEGLKRRVAIKVLPEAAARDADFLVNFKREAQAIAKLNHPNIVQIFDIDEDRGYHFFSMEYVDGESLADRLERKGRLPLPEAVQIVAQAAVALDYACERMLVHRDIKPSNLLLAERGGVKVADLGLLKSLEGTSVSMVRGTHGGPLYMAPEFAKNPRLVDCRSDIYALGAVLFHALTGRPPFRGSSTAEIILQHAEAPMPSARALAPEVPQSVEGLLKKMCAKDPAERFQNYTELLDAMQALLKSTAIRLPQTDTGSPTVRRGGRKSALPVAIAVAAAVLVVAGLLIVVVPRLGSGRSQAVAPATSTSPEPEKSPAPPPEKPTPPVVPEEKKEPEDKGKDVVEPPKPKEKPPEPKEEPKAEPKEEPKEAPKKGDAPAWEARLAEARRSAGVLAAEGQFGKALTVLEELTKDNEDADLVKAVAEARAAVQAQAAKAYEAVVKKAGALAAQGKLDETRAALQAVVDTYGTDAEVVKAKEAVDAIDQFKESQATLVKGVDAARATADATARRAARQAEVAKGLQGVQALLENWQFDEALAELGKLKFEDPAFAAQVEQRKAATEALATFRDAVARHIKTAEPRLRKSDLRVSGLNGDLTDADKEGITAVVTGGGGHEKEKTPWAKLAEPTVERLTRLRGIVKLGDPTQQLAIGFWYLLLGSDEKARATLARAGELGAKTDALREPVQPPEKAEKEVQAARAFADTLKLVLEGKSRAAAAALAGYKEKFGDTDYYVAQERLYEVASAYKPYTPPSVAEVPPEPPPEPKQKEPTPKQKQPEPKEKQPAPKQKQPEPKPPQPGDEAKAKECYERAATAFRAHQFDECKKHLAALRQASPASRLLSDKKLTPTVEAMQKAVDARGQLLKVSPGTRGAHASVDKAVAAIEKPRATIEIDEGIYSRGNIAVPGKTAEGLILRGMGDKRPRLDGGVKRDTILKFAKDAKGVWLENLEFANTKAAIDLEINCSITLRDCVAIHNVDSAFTRHPVTNVTLAASILRLDKMADVRARHSAVQLADKATVEGGEIVGSILVGNDIAFRKVTLTDCLVIGDGVLKGDVKLNHVTAIGPLTVPDDSRNNTVTDSILAALLVADGRAKAKDKRAEVAVTLKDTALYAQTRPWPKDQVKTEGEVLVRATRPPFADPHGPDYRLPEGSPLADKASDKTALGCRFPPETFDLLRTVAKRYPQLLKPPPASRR